MPHEKVWDSTNHSIEADGTLVPATQRGAIISWSHGPTPSDDYSDPDGWVQLTTNDYARPARFAVDTAQEAEARLIELLTDLKREGEEQAETLPPEWVQRIAQYLSPHVRYAFGEPVGGFAVTLDRTGINRTIRLLQRARDIAYGRDA